MNFGIFTKIHSGLLASLSFVNCSDTAQLYVKPLQFRLNHRLSPEGDFETLLDELRENAQYTTSKVLGIELSKEDEQFGEESINLLRELKNLRQKELHFKISFTFQENFPQTL